MGARRKGVKEERKAEQKLSRLCSQCGYFFSHRSGLMKHIRKGCKGVEQRQTGPFQCEKCSRKYTTKPILNRHLINCKGIPRRSSNDVWHCLICRSTFSCRQNLHRHKKMHKTTEKNQYEQLIKAVEIEGTSLPNTTHRDLKSAIDAFERPDNDEKVAHENVDNVEETIQNDDDFVQPNGLPPLTAHMMRVIANAKSLSDTNCVNEQSVQKNGVDILNGCSLRTLDDGEWVDDKIVNGYFQLLQIRAENDKRLLKIYTFTPWDYHILVSGFHWNIEEPRPKIFEYDILIFPIHRTVHWGLCAVFLKQKTIHYYDSMGGKNPLCFRTILNFIRDEVKEQQKVGNDVEDSMSERKSWTTIYPTCPQQENGIDCGLFVCQCAEYLSRGADLNFVADQMPYYRRRMMYELVTGKIDAL